MSETQLDMETQEPQLNQNLEIDENKEQIQQEIAQDDGLAQRNELLATINDIDQLVGLNIQPTKEINNSNVAPVPELQIEKQENEISIPQVSTTVLLQSQVLEKIENDPLPGGQLQTQAEQQQEELHQEDEIQEQNEIQEQKKYNENQDDQQCIQEVESPKNEQNNQDKLQDQDENFEQQIIQNSNLEIIQDQIEIKQNPEIFPNQEIYEIDQSQEIQQIQEDDKQKNEIELDQDISQVENKNLISQQDELSQIINIEQKELDSLKDLEINQDKKNDNQTELNFENQQNQVNQFNYENDQLNSMDQIDNKIVNEQEIRIQSTEVDKIDGDQINYTSFTGHYQHEDEQGLTALENQGENNFEESVIHPNLQIQPVTGEREDLNRSDIGEIVQTLQELKNRGAQFTPQDANNVIQQNKMLIKQNFEYKRMIDDKDLQIINLQNQLQNSFNQINILTNGDNDHLFMRSNRINKNSLSSKAQDFLKKEMVTNMFQDVSSISNINGKSLNQQRDTTNQDDLNTSNQFKGSWIFNVEKKLDQNEFYQPFLKQQKHITHNDYLSRKAFQIGRLPSLKKQKDQSRIIKEKIEKNIPFVQKFEEKIEKIIPFSQKFSNSKYPQNNQSDVSNQKQVQYYGQQAQILNLNETMANNKSQIFLMHEKQRLQIELMVKQQISRNKMGERSNQNLSDSYSDLQDEKEIEKIFSQNSPNKIINYEKDVPTLTDQYQSSDLQNGRSLQYRQVKLQQPELFQQIKQQQQKQKQSQQLSTNILKITSPKVLVRTDSQEMIKQIQTNTNVSISQNNLSLHTFQEKQFPLLAQKKSYYNQAQKRKELYPVNTSPQPNLISSDTFQNMQSSKQKFKSQHIQQVLSPRDGLFRKTPGFQLN